MKNITFKTIWQIAQCVDSTRENKRSRMSGNMQESHQNAVVRRNLALEL